MGRGKKEGKKDAQKVLSNWGDDFAVAGYCEFLEKCTQ